MGFRHSVTMQDGSVYDVTALLAKANSNTKTAKSDKANVGIMTVSLSLAPAKASGFNLCPAASPACMAGCLYISGLAWVFPRTIQPARIAKSRMLRMSPKVFQERLEKELASKLKSATNKGLQLAVRLNVLSDVQWEKEMPGIFKNFPTIQFYDYSKLYKRMIGYTEGLLPSNYHLTFSWSGTNKDQCIDILRRGSNVAVPFHTGKNNPLPSEFLGYPVFNGDLTDLRFRDPKNVIVGLKAKGKARKDFTSGFVVPVKSGVAVEVKNSLAQITL